VCCVTVDGDAVVVAATAWNRLGTFLAATGRLLTSRETEWVRGQPRPEHYLDYFHGRLLASPGGRWILDDGWVWSPVGVPTVIDVAAWLSGQIHTAENGAALSHRAYAWDQPVAWLDDHTVAIQRIGYDDEQMLAGVQLFDVPTGLVSAAFAGPSGRMWAHRGRLYVVSTAGTEIWEPAVGARIGILEGFAPTAHNDRTGTLAEFSNGVCRTWTPE